MTALQAHDATLIHLSYKFHEKKYNRIRAPMKQMCDGFHSADEAGYFGISLSYESIRSIVDM